MARLTRTFSTGLSAILTIHGGFDAGDAQLAEFAALLRERNTIAALAPDLSAHIYKNRGLNPPRVSP
jgi:hypothetical protein